MVLRCRFSITSLMILSARQLRNTALDSYVKNHCRSWTNHAQERRMASFSNLITFLLILFKSFMPVLCICLFTFGIAFISECIAFFFFKIKLLNQFFTLSLYIRSNNALFCFCNRMLPRWWRILQRKPDGNNVRNYLSEMVQVLSYQRKDPSRKGTSRQQSMSRVNYFFKDPKLKQFMVEWLFETINYL
jgi:hypothetical protein